MSHVNVVCFSLDGSGQLSFLCPTRYFCILENVSALLSSKHRVLLLYILKESFVI